MSVISFKTAKEAKDEGFNEPCDMCYNENGELVPVKLDMNGHPNMYDGYYAAPTHLELDAWIEKKAFMSYMLNKKPKRL